MRQESKEIAQLGTSASASAGALCWIALALLLGVAVSFGCRGAQLPAIDPSGERIFLPAPNTTTFESCLPRPAFAAPPAPPACAPLAAAPLLPAAPLQGTPLQTVLPVSGASPLTPGRNQLKLTPSRIVAPVGSEVVLVAGYCGGDGYFVTHQPVEWTLTQDSVGHLVEVGQAPECLGGILHEMPKKLSANFAVGRTATHGQLITRGNQNPADDVRIHKGQSWLSVTSPTEGNSHVTVLAPKAEGWDQRRQTATIHWIDAQWTLPAPAIVRAGQPVTLATLVTRATNGSPLTGWLVQYEIIGGSPAKFANGQTTIEVQTDAAGHANIELMQDRSGPGLAQVAIQIIRPASASGELPRTPVGQGFTNVTWSAPGLTVNVLGPDAVPVELVGVYQIQVMNHGDLTTPDVVVSSNTPPNFEFVSSDPPGQFFTGQMQWQLGDLQARQTRVINVQLRAKRPGDVRVCASAQSRADATITAEGCKDRTRVFAPALSVALAGPQRVEIGQPFTFELTVTNNSELPLNNVTLNDTFDPGLAHQEGATSPIYVSLGALGPGQSQTKGVTFVARQPGVHCHTVEVMAEGGHAASARGCVTAVAPVNPATTGQGLVQAKIATAPRLRLGERPLCRMSVANLGSTPLNNLQIVCNFDENLAPSQATPEYQQVVRGQMSWAVRQLPPGQTLEREIEFNPPTLPQSLTFRLTVTAEPNVFVREQATSEVVPESGRLPGTFASFDHAEPRLQDRDEQPAASAAKAAPSDLNNSSGSTEPPSWLAAPSSPVGQLTVDISDAQGPIRVGSVASYLIVIKNQRNVSDRDVVLSVELPEGIDWERRPPRITGPTGTAKISADRRTLELLPIQEMRAGDVLQPYRLECVPLRSGSFQVRAEVRSRRSAAPISDVESAVVSAN